MDGRGFRISLCVLILGGCRPNPPGPEVVEPAPPPAVPSLRPPVAPPSATVRSPSDAERRATAIAHARECGHGALARLEPAPQGAVFNNAQTRKDAGRVDRMQDLVDAFRAAFPRFQCCLGDAFARTGDDAIRVTLVVEVDAGGKALSSRVDATEDLILKGCLNAEATAIAASPSPQQRNTTVVFPLVATRDAVANSP
ncbi:MAG: hypothetical protein AAGA56_19350 [Myxococcota bacterium]